MLSRSGANVSCDCLEVESSVMSTGPSVGKCICGLHAGVSTLIVPGYACSEPSCEKADISRVYEDIDERGDDCADCHGNGERETG